MESGEKDLLSKQAILSLPRDKEFNLEGKLLAEYINVKDIEALQTIQPVAADTNVGDTISRQQAIDALDCINGTEEVLRSLPPAQPERKEGKWIKVADAYRR